MCTDGTPDTEATVVECKSFTGSIALLGGGAIEAICQRQHLKNPDSHIAEVTAGGGVGAGLQRLAFYNLDCIARDAGSVKKSAWTYRRSAVVYSLVRQCYLPLMPHDYCRVVCEW